MEDKRESSNFQENASRAAQEAPKPSWTALVAVALLASVAVQFVPWATRFADKHLGIYVERFATRTHEPYVLCSPEGERKIYTVDDAGSTVACVAIEKQFLVGSGDLENLEMAKKWPVVRIPEGAIVLPGLSDSHCHILEYGAGRQIPLGDAKSVEETVQMIASYILSNDDLRKNASEIVLGWGWDHQSWSNPRFPTALDLEANPTTRGRPIILQSKDGHAIWVSQATLDANGPFPDTIPGGVIRRGADGKPDGVFLDSAQDLVEMPVISEKEKARRFHSTVNDALAYGLTSLHDAGFKPESLPFFLSEVKRHGKLPIRVYGMAHFDENGPYWGNLTKPISKAGNAHRLSARSVKIFADALTASGSLTNVFNAGALRTGGAALYEPYADDPSTSGQMRVSAEVLNTVIPRYMKDGWQVNVHAIGDRANGLVLDAFELALNEMGLRNATSLRPRLEHAQILTDADIQRIGSLGVIASVQPTHVISDMWFGEARLGPNRVKGLYAFRSLLSSGARITLGSDFPVESMNPLSGFYAAITRLSTDGRSPSGPGGWFPEQRLTRLEALRGMTIDPAYASFTEATLGSLERGKRADYVVLSRDIMQVPVEDILKTRVIATALDGEIVFGAL